MTSVLVLQDGDVLINYGERGDKLYLIRYGKVKVMRPDDKGGRIEVVQLSRGQFVGERTLITGDPSTPLSAACAVILASL